MTTLQTDNDNKNEIISQPSKNWIFRIETGYKTIDQIPGHFFQNFMNTLRALNISFIIYRLFQGETYAQLLVYLELTKNARFSKIRKFFGFSENAVIMYCEDKKLIRNTSRLYIEKVIEECVDFENELYWLGTPRHHLNRSTLNFHFVLKYNLISKARKDPFVPEKFKDLFA